ncbi:MAG: signal peptide peptidase SppA [Alphaproteobacteria bacterium]|nr:signal peptide peptidase SppA [Alphaproteobacteria bacterium]
MTFESDSLIDRRRLKRRLGLWRIAAVVAAASLLLALFARLDISESRDHVARISVRGIIVEDQKRIEAIEDVARDNSAKALIVAINSPGGTVVGGQSLFQQLRAVAAKKPVVTVMGTLGTSGGYMVAVGADRIFAQPGTITGSIGVILQTTDLTGMLDKLGIKPISIKSDPLKAVPSPFEPLSKEGRAVAQAVVSDTHRQFLDMVAERRGLTPENARVVGDGRIYTGRQALANGLIDALGGEQEARDWLAEQHKVSADLPVREVRINRGTKNLFGLVEEMFGKTLFSERLTLDGLIAVWHPE